MRIQKKEVSKLKIGQKRKLPIADCLHLKPDIGLIHFFSIFNLDTSLYVFAITKKVKSTLETLRFAQA